MTHMSWDTLMQVDTHALNEMAQTAFKSIDHVLGDLNDDLTAPCTPIISDDDTSSSHVTSPRSVYSADELPTGATNPPKTARVCVIKEKTRPDTPTPLSPPTPEEYNEARRIVQWNFLYKTSDCTSWTFGYGCPCGNKCRFRHPNEKLNPRPDDTFIDKEIKAEAWRLAELRQVPHNKPSRQHARRRR